MNLPHKLFVKSANKTCEHMQIIATKNSNERQHMPDENTILQYSTNNCYKQSVKYLTHAQKPTGIQLHQLQYRKLASSKVM